MSAYCYIDEDEALDRLRWAPEDISEEEALHYWHEFQQDAEKLKQLSGLTDIKNLTLIRLWHAYGEEVLCADWLCIDEAEIEDFLDWILWK